MCVFKLEETLFSEVRAKWYSPEIIIQSANNYYSFFWENTASIILTIIYLNVPFNRIWICVILRASLVSIFVLKLLVYTQYVFHL